MPFNLKAFEASVLEPQGEAVTKDEPKETDKWPVKGFIIREAWSMTDDLGVAFVDLGELTAYSDIDGRHLDAEGHAAVGHATAQAVTRLS